jgi:flagellin
MSEITLSKAVRSNLLNLQSTASLLGKSQERLSSGLRVNSALDNPTNFFTAQGLNSRANDLSQLSDAVSNAVQTVAAADKGITAITKLVESAQATARQALQTSATVSQTTVTAQATVTGTVALSDDAAAVITGSVTGLAGTDTLDTLGYADGDTITLTSTSGGTTTYTVGTAATDTLSDLVTGLTANTGADVAITGGAVVATAVDATETLTFGGTPAGLTGLGLTTTAASATNTQLTTTLSGQTLTIGSETLTFGSGANIGTRAELDTALAGLTGAVSGSVNGTDNIVLTGSGDDAFTVGGTAATALGFTAGTIDPTETTSDIANPKRAELVNTYNDLLGQIDALAKDSGFNGVNLLNGDDLSVLFNEDGTSKLDITGVTDDAATLGLAALGTTGFDTNTAINSTLDDLKGAIETLRSQSAKFGANLSVVETRQEFTKNMINVLQTGAANLTLADTNEEAANVLALQTRQQLSSTALSLASQADQNVLRLF